MPIQKALGLSEEGLMTTPVLGEAPRGGSGEVTQAWPRVMVKGAGFAMVFGQKSSTTSYRFG